MAAAAEALWAPAGLRLLRTAVAKTASLARTKVAAATRPFASATVATATTTLAGRAANKARNATTASYLRPAEDILRRFFSTSPHPAGLRGSSSRHIARDTTINRVQAGGTGRAPFASTLRPSLTGGALPRSAGGYGLGAGGGARYFSHTPAAPAEILSNVSQAMRAFFLNGQRARYDGVGPRGEARYRAVSAVEDRATRKIQSAPRFAPGAFIDYRLGPTVTALSPLLAAGFPYAAGTAAPSANSPAAAIPEIAPPAATLNTDRLLDFLCGDFERAARDLTAILTDLKRLAFLGDLPITLESPTVLRVRFPGVDADTVERLCDDLGVRRGYIGEDRGFDLSAGVGMALKFPCAPDDSTSHGAKVLAPPGGSPGSRTSDDDLFFDDADGLIDQAYLAEIGLSELEGYELGSFTADVPSTGSDYEGVDGVYRFLEECDRAKGRF